MTKIWYSMIFTAGFITPFIISCDKPAPPMKGTCVDVTVTRYEGVRTRDNKRCNWRGFIWDCSYSDQYSEWTCNSIAHAPIEQTKMEPAR